MAQVKSRIQLNNEIRVLRRIIGSLEVYAELSHGLDVDDHLDLYRNWLDEAMHELSNL